MEQQDAASKNSCLACGLGGFIAERDVRAAFFWLLFFAAQRKVTRATRETLLLEDKSRRAKSLGLRLRGDDGKNKIKSTPPQSSPALHAREEAKPQPKPSQWRKHKGEGRLFAGLTD